MTREEITKITFVLRNEHIIELAIKSRRLSIGHNFKGLWPVRYF